MAFCRCPMDNWLASMFARTAQIGPTHALQIGHRLTTEIANTTSPSPSSRRPMLPISIQTFN